MEKRENRLQVLSKFSPERRRDRYRQPGFYYNCQDPHTETVPRYGIIFIWKLSNGLVSGFYDFEFHEDPR